MKPDKKKFFEDHMPHLEDENKIYGDRGAGAPGNPWMDGANIVLGGIRGYTGAGGDFGFGSKASTGPAIGTRTETGGITGWAGGSGGNLNH